MASSELAETLKDLGQELVTASKSNLDAHEDLQELAAEGHPTIAQLNGFRQQLSGLEQQSAKLKRHVSLAERLLTDQQRNKGNASMGGAKSRDRKKSAPAWKAGFRLSEEEQELAYELKAKMMRVINEQNAQLETELNMHRQMEETKANHMSKQAEKAEGNLARTSALKLVRMYERRSKENAVQLDELELELERAQSLAAEYQSRYETECKKSGSEPAPPPEQPEDRKSASSRPSTSHTRGARAASARLATPVSRGTPTEAPEARRAKAEQKDAVRLNECLLRENSEMRKELQKMRGDNQRLLLDAKRSAGQAQSLSRDLQTCQASKAELLKRLEKELHEKDRLRRSMTRQSNDWMTTKKVISQHLEEQRWGQMQNVSPHEAQERTFGYKVKRADKQPKRMFPVTHYDRPHLAH